MSWEAAKSWLIVVFLVLDLILGWQYAEARHEAASYTESYSDLVANTKTLLAEHNFSLAAAIPQEHPVMASLQTSDVQVSYKALQKAVFPNAKHPVLNQDSGVIQSSYGQLRFETTNTWRVDYTHPLQVDGKGSKALLSYVWNGANYRLDDAMSGGEFEVYDQTYEQHLLFDAQLIAHKTNGMLSGYEQTATGSIHAAGNPKPTITALEALTSLSNSVDKSGSPKDNVIEHIDLGYALKTQSNAGGDSSEQYWFPVWRVVTSSSQIYDVNAFTGEVNTSS